MCTIDMSSFLLIFLSSLEQTPPTFLYIAFHQSIYCVVSKQLS
jgi:hypothetical protein